MENADAQRGACLLLASNDGKVTDCTFYGGEHQIRQPSGGTIEISRVHPWCGAWAFNRRYFGTAGTVISTGIQIRTPSQISTFDRTKVSVTRRASDWQVMVTLLVNIPQAEAAPMMIRRDEVLALMNGWGCNWSACYLDGGTIRMGTNGHLIDEGSTYSLGRAMSETADGIPPTMVSILEWQPRTASEYVPYKAQYSSTSIGKKMVTYPRLNQTSWPSSMQWTAEAMEAIKGLMSPARWIHEALDSIGMV